MSNSKAFDKIDIYSPPVIKIAKLKSHIKGENRVSIKGSSVDYSVVNAIRRSILLYIPIYAFHRSNITIDSERSKHMYNNDLIYSQIETLPIFDIPNDHVLDNPKIYLTNEIMRNIFGHFVREQFEEQVEDEQTTSNIEIAINYKNRTDGYHFLSTHDIILKIDDKISDNYQKREPISLLVLKPGEELYMSAVANMGIAKINASYESSTNVTFKKFSETDYELWYETLGQLNEDTIFEKAVVILQKKLHNLKNHIKEIYGHTENHPPEIKLELHGEDHTIGNLLATTLQRCDMILTAGYDMPHLFTNYIVIRYQIVKKSPKNSIEVLTDCLTYLIDLFSTVHQNWTK